MKGDSDTLWPFKDTVTFKSSQNYDSSCTANTMTFGAGQWAPWTPDSSLTYIQQLKVVSSLRVLPYLTCPTDI